MGWTLYFSRTPCLYCSSLKTWSALSFRYEPLPTPWYLLVMMTGKTHSALAPSWSCATYFIWWVPKDSWTGGVNPGPTIVNLFAAVLSSVHVGIFHSTNTVDLQCGSLALTSRGQFADLGGWSVERKLKVVQNEFITIFKGITLVHLFWTVTNKLEVLSSLGEQKLTYISRFVLDTSSSVCRPYRSAFT